MVKLVDIAEAAGVSPATVSRVLNDSLLVSDEKRERVLKAVRDLNYIPLRPLRGYNADGETPPPNNTMARKLILVIHSRMNEMNYGAMIMAASDLGYGICTINIMDFAKKNEENAIQVIQTLQNTVQLAGVLLYGNVVSNGSRLQQILETCPVVQIGEHAELSNCGTVTIDNQAAVYDTVKYLLACGCKRPVLLVRSMGEHATLCEQHRIWGYRLAMLEAGFEVENMQIYSADDTMEGGAETVEEILQTGFQPDAIIASSDLAAMGSIKVLQYHGLRVPEDVAVVGLEDNGLGLLSEPELSTMAAGQGNIASDAIELLHKLITGAMQPGCVMPYPRQLIVRGSSPVAENVPGLLVHPALYGRWIGRQTKK